MRQLDPVLLLKDFHRNALRRADAGSPVVDLCGIRLGILDEFLERLNADAGIDDQRERRSADRADVGKVLLRAVGQLGEMLIGIEHRALAVEDRVAIRRRLHQRARREISGSPRTVVDDQRNAQFLLHALGNESYDDVGGAARCKADQPSDRPGGVAVGSFDCAAQRGNPQTNDKFTSSHAWCVGICSSASSSDSYRSDSTSGISTFGRPTTNSSISLPAELSTPSPPSTCT